MISRSETESEGIFDLVMGLPVHPLIVHAVVVLIPLAALAAILMAVRPSISKKYGLLVIAIALIGQVSSFIARTSGEALEERLDVDLERHADMGEIAPLTSLPLLLLIAVLYRIDTKGWISSSRKFFAALTIVSAIFAAGYIALTGHSGAESVWSWVKDL
jgi:hypothetical protein